MFPIIWLFIAQVLHHYACWTLSSAHSANSLIYSLHCIIPSHLCIINHSFLSANLYIFSILITSIVSALLTWLSAVKNPLLNLCFFPLSFERLLKSYFQAFYHQPCIVFMSIFCQIIFKNIPLKHFVLKVLVKWMSLLLLLLSSLFSLERHCKIEFSLKQYFNFMFSL